MMKATITTWFFLAVMLVAGLATGGGAYGFPAAAHGSFPAYTWPLMAAFVCELLMRSRIEAGVLPPLPMPIRFIGVIGATLIGYVVEHGMNALQAVDPVVLTNQ